MDMLNLAGVIKLQLDPAGVRSRYGPISPFGNQAGTLGVGGSTLIHAVDSTTIARIGPVADVIHRPRHPYTVGLMGSIPSIAARPERLAQIDGTMPRLTAIPGGCAFHPRCVRAIARCRMDRPELARVGATEAACWNPVATP